MELPTGLKGNDIDFGRVESDEELYELLLKNSYQLINFFSMALTDETWSQKHLPFFQKILEWITGRFVESRVTEIEALKIADAIHAHYNVISSVIPRSFAIEAGSKKFSVNPILLGTSSPFWRRTIQELYREKGAHSILLETELPLDVLELIFTWVERGDSGDIWKWNINHLTRLLNCLEKWELKKFAEEIEKLLCRYIDHDNAIEKLVDAHRLQREVLKRHAIQVFNQYSSGLKLFSHEKNQLGVEFLDFHLTTLESAKKVSTWVTVVKFSKEIAFDEEFETALSLFPHVIALDISGSESWSSYFEFLPKTLKELDLSRTSWVSEATLKKIAEIVPHIEILKLAGNTQLTYKSLGELRRLPSLRALDLSECHQLIDNELLIVLQVAQQLTSLSLAKCKKLTDQAFYDLARKGSLLEWLDLSGTALTEGGLVEIGQKCKRLENLSLNDCPKISDRGIRQFLKLSKSLKCLSLKESSWDEETHFRLQEEFADVQIVR